MKKYKLQNLDCVACATNLEKNIKNLDYVQSVSINFASLSMNIETSNIGKVLSEINKLEPEIKPIELKTGSRINKDKIFDIKKELISIFIAVILIIPAIIFKNYFEKSQFYFVEYIIFLFIYIYSGYKVLFKAFSNITKGNVFDENFLMTIATLGAILINAVPEAAATMLLYKIGDFLQRLSVNNSRKSITSLLEVRPDYANLKNNNDIITVHPEEVKINDLIIVKPGEKIPLDGIIISGTTQVNTSILTGESAPRILKENDFVMAGMINNTGLITVKITKLFEDSSISKILELVENATNKKAKTEQFFTTFAKYYTPIIVAFAFLIAVIPPIVFNESFIIWIKKALGILVVSCPCALVISIPLAYFSGIGKASKKGILIKGSNFLDGLSQIKSIVFDKTGTLTKGVFNVTQIVTKNGFSKDALLEFAAIAENYSNHPIAISIKESYGKKINSHKIIKHEEIGGHGIVAEFEDKKIIVGNDKLLHLFNIEHDTCDVTGTVAHIAINNKYCGYLIISDALKDDSIIAIKQLRKIGINKIFMLTGDNKEIAKDISNKLELDNYFAELLPEEKLIELEDILSKNKQFGKTAFVGDGVNDAPVIARADIGISMGNLGSDAAIETADIVIMNDSLSKIPEAISLSKKTKSILIQNIVFALGIKALFIILLIFGISTMWEAVFGDMGVTLIAIFNSMRILRK